MTEPIEEAYFRWLCDRVNIGNGKTYDDLLGQIHTKEFVWMVPNDDNRLEDCVDLRRSFLNGNAIPDLNERETMLLMGVPPISVLEILIGLSERLSFMAEGRPEDWAWRLIENLELHKMHDPVSPRKAEIIDDILEVLIWRQYNFEGVGGFFPLTSSEEDQAKLELWYQMAVWLEQQEH